MTETSFTLQTSSPDQNIPSNKPIIRRRSISINSYETATPSVKSLSSFETSDLQINNSLSLQNESLDLTSAYDKLINWKCSMEKQLNRIYLQKLKEIDTLLVDGQNSIDIIFAPIPLFEQLATVTFQQRSTDHRYDNIEFDYENAHKFDITSNNILLCTSNHYALLYDDLKQKLTLYNHQKCFKSYLWDTNEYGDPCDLTYSYYLDLYCIITHRGLFTWSHESPYSPVHVDSIKTIAGNRLWTVASTDSRSDIFVLFKLGSYVERWNSAIGDSRWQRIQRWSNHDLFERNDQRIRTIRLTSTYVGWSVESTKTSEWRIDLLDYNLQVIRKGINIDNLDKYSSCLLSNFGPDQFLIIDSNRHSLFLFDSNGNIKNKTDHFTAKRIKNAVLMNTNHENWLVIRLEQPNQLCFVSLKNKTES